MLFTRCTDSNLIITSTPYFRKRCFHDKKEAGSDFVLVLLLAAAAGFLVNQTMHKKPAAQVEITVDGKLVQTLDLNKNADLIIDGVNGGTNHLIIQDGTAWISEASCPDKVCVHHGKVSLNGELIVCLPTA